MLRAEEEEFDSTTVLQKKEQELIKNIEAINAVLKTEEWQVLKGRIFEGVVENLEKRLKLEAEKKELDNPELYRLQGQIAWAKTYADLGKLVERFKIELLGIKKQYAK